jgi:hypothetical protein
MNGAWFLVRGNSRLFFLKPILEPSLWRLAVVRSSGLLALAAAAGEIHKAWATFVRVTGAKEAEPNFRMTTFPEILVGTLAAQETR